MKKNAKNLIVWGLFIQVSKIRLLTWNFYTLYYMQMKNYELFKRDQFKNCQATECKREDENGNVVTIFYSYQCPELVKIKGDWHRFSFENSRKAGCWTSSRTTSKQLTRYFWPEWRDLPVMNLQEFENEYFYTGIDWLY